LLYEKQDDSAAQNPFIAAVLNAQGKDDAEVWPENWPVFEIFAGVGTQWRIGMAGPTGLDYNAIYPLLDRVFDCRDDWDDAFLCIRVMESAALEVLNGR
jgi:hypothetical protein